nr:DUF3900 domain-containing protein [Virgibacillus ndiopensis]
MQYLSFYLIQVDGNGQSKDKRYKHLQTLDNTSYEDSPLKTFLVGELTKIVKRNMRSQKVVLRKLADLLSDRVMGSNPNYNLFQKVRFAESTQDFQKVVEEIVQLYMDTSAIRGGALLVASTKLTKFFEDLCFLKIFAFLFGHIYLKILHFLPIKNDKRPNFMLGDEMFGEK